MLLSSKLQNKDDTYVYVADSNEYIYETIAETSGKVNNHSYLYVMYRHMHIVVNFMFVH